MKKAYFLLVFSWVVLVSSSGYAAFPPEENRCFQPNPQAQQLLGKKLSWLRLHQQTPTPQGVFLGERFIANGCERYRGGLRGLAREIKTELEKGLACMSKLPGSLHQEAVALMSLLERPPRPILLQCGREWNQKTLAGGELSFSAQDTQDAPFIARVYGCAVSEEFPRIDINLTALEKINYEYHEWVLHEFTHPLGYMHTGGVDYSYLISMCCLGADPRKKARACDLIQRMHNPPTEEDVYAFYALQQGAEYLFLRYELNSLLALFGAKPNRILDFIHAVYPVGLGGIPSSERALQRASVQKKLQYAKKVFQRIIHLYGGDPAEQAHRRPTSKPISVCLRHKANGACAQNKLFHPTVSSEQKWTRELPVSGQPLLGIAAYSMALEMLAPWIPSYTKKELEELVTKELFLPFYPPTDPIDSQKRAFAWEVGKLVWRYKEREKGKKLDGSDRLDPINTERAIQWSQQLCQQFSEKEERQLQAIPSLLSIYYRAELDSLVSPKLCQPQSPKNNNTAKKSILSHMLTGWHWLGIAR